MNYVFEKINQVLLYFWNRNGDILCEMRFYVPNMEKTDEDEEPGKDAEDKIDSGANKDGDEKSENSADEITPAKIFNDQILKFANLGDSAGEIIASFHDLPLMVPRGKYTLNMFSNYAKFHGRTHDYKIMYKDIVKMF